MKTKKSMKDENITNFVK